MKIIPASGGTGVNSGTGDAQSMYVATTPQLQRYVSGTAASPDTVLHPLVKVERTIAHADTVVSGDGGEQLASIMGIGVGTAACEVQPVGVYGAAKTSSIAGNPGNDACGLYGAGRITDSGTGVGIGGFFIGRRDNDTGKACGIEVHTANYGTVADTLTVAGSTNLRGIWINAGGNADSGAAFQLGNAFGRQFAVGIHINGQVNNAKTGGARDASIRDDGNATTSIDLRGSHSYGIDMANGAFSIAAIRMKKRHSTCMA